MSRKLVCHNCGEEWDTHPARAVPCAQCKAPRFHPCRRPSGHEMWGDSVHRVREQAAVDQGLLAKCGGGETAKPPSTLF